jgi:formamidopyrimidine-DNA glycosylase
LHRIERIGKRMVFAFEDECFLVLHLMIAGRLHWQKAGAKIPAKKGLAALDFPNGSLVITEASTQKRASLHLIQGHDQLQSFDRGGIDVLQSTLAEFATVMRSENHTLKRALTDPRLLSGIGNAYSDEILHRARLSPVTLTEKLSDEHMSRLYQAIRNILLEWAERLRKEAGKGLPKKVTAFRPEMAVHGRYGQLCPVCNSKIQRIRYATNETNYCPTCQTGGKLLADRALSRLLKKDWPRTIEELEARKREA